MMNFCLRLPARRCLRGNHGFTLIELIITIVLLGLLGAVGVTMISDSFDTSRRIDASETNSGQARYALERMAREIREVKYSGGAYSIATRTASSMVFTKGNDVTVTLTSSGGNLTLAYSSPATTATLANRVDNFALAYYQADGVTPATSNSDIRFVQISLTLYDSSSGSIGGRSIAQRIRIALRNA